MADEISLRSVYTQG